MERIAIEHIRVRAGRLDLEVRVDCAVLHVSEALAADMLRLLPNMGNHACINDKGPAFGDEVVGTELPHLFEHMVIELQGQAYKAAGMKPPKLTGHTSWLPGDEDDAVKRMRVTVAFTNDFVALQAASEAVDLLDAALGRAGELPDSAQAAIDSVRAVLERERG